MRRNPTSCADGSKIAMLLGTLEMPDKTDRLVKTLYHTIYLRPLSVGEDEDEDENENENKNEDENENENKNKNVNENKDENEDGTIRRRIKRRRKRPKTYPIAIDASTAASIAFHA
jgi:hypothetical protein